MRRSMTQFPTPTLSVVDLFAGCGGLSLGLEYAGFTPVFVNELNENARASYLRNRTEEFPWFSDPGFSSGDIKELLASDPDLRGLKTRLLQAFGIQDVDIVSGGPPCQGFSGIGHRRTYGVARKSLPSNHLFQDMAQIISALRPKIFLFENVRGLLTARWTENGQKGEIWNEVQQTFRKIPDYTVESALVYAKHYGVAQNRPRILLVGLRNDIRRATKVPLTSGIAGGFLPAAIPRKAPDLCDLLGDLVDPTYTAGQRSTQFYPTDPTNEIQRFFRTLPNGKVLEAGAPITEHDYSNHRELVVAKFKAMHASGGKIPAEFATKKFAQRLLPPKWQATGPTITATSLPDDYVHFSQPRVLSVREWARLQGFPDWYQFSGPRTTGGLRRAGNPIENIHARELPKYTQIGNAVPVALAHQVGLHFRSLLSRDTVTHARAPNGKIPSSRS